MGIARGDSGAELPGDEHGLPGLPPEWGTIVVPETPAALDAEGARVRRHFRREARRRRIRRLLRLRPAPLRQLRTPRDGGLRTPVVVMGITIFATLASLFALGWPGLVHGQRRLESTHPAYTTLLTTVLADPAGTPVRLRETLPAILLLVDGCTDCDGLVTSVRHRADPAVTVLEIVGTASDAGTPRPDQGARMDPAGAGRFLVLVDPRQVVRNALPDLVSTAGPAGVLIGRDGEVVRVVPDLHSVADFGTDLSHLAG